LAAIGAIGGVLGTILSIFNQQEIHNILNRVSTLETNQNLIINVAQLFLNLSDKSTFQSF